jgi:hypothetical protein
VLLTTEGVCIYLYLFNILQSFEDAKLWVISLELWNSGTLKLWNFGTLELWNFETLEL